MAPVRYGLPDSPTGDPLPMVLLRHVQGGRPEHLDWFIARGQDSGPLAAWRLPSWPGVGQEVGPVEGAEDHDRDWLQREGVVSGDRGAATRVDAGVLVRWHMVEAAAQLVVRWRDGGDQTLSLLSDSRGWLLRRDL